MPKRILSGKVVKKSGDKTISVLVTRQTTHPIYKKLIRVSKKYLAHDSENKIIVGDSVRIQETKPISKNKSWEVIK
ncbi:30S ribosomal protein S17 [Alphaproteobacteria bacterium]|nr:30S ribosomal protein S17 [Alphaproteobacteria bacterium]MDC3146305.1 30S ribosomal protein S17 [Alphaproteobacteria bacterium]